MAARETVDIFTAATWRAEERAPGHWYVVETILSSFTETHYGPMWPEMVEPLIEELREIIRCTLARAKSEIVYGSRELRLPTHKVSL